MLRQVPAERGSEEPAVPLYRVDFVVLLATITLPTLCPPFALRRTEHEAIPRLREGAFAPYGVTVSAIDGTSPAER